MRYITFPVVLLLSFLSVEAQERLPNGKRLYESACSACHGVYGDGKGPAANGLNPRPRDLTTGWYKFTSTQHGQMPMDEDIIKTISKGVPTTWMPAFDRIFNEDEIWDIVEYIKTFSDRFERWGPGEPIDIPREIPMTRQTIADGKNIYRVLRCWDCHGEDGRGKGPISSKLKDEKGNSIRAFDFTIGTYKAGSTNRDIYRTFNTGLSGTPMASFYGAFMFGKEDLDLASYEEFLSAEQTKEFLDYVSTLPSNEELDALSEEEREELANNRKWSLVHYVKSLARKKGLFYRFFAEDMEVTR